MRPGTRHEEDLVKSKTVVKSLVGTDPGFSELVETLFGGMYHPDDVWLARLALGVRWWDRQWDYKERLVNEYGEDPVSRYENVKAVTVMEESTVDKGGCIIETDFGQIDARISSQLHEIEEKILDMMPIRSKGG